MTQNQVSDLATRLIALNGGNIEQAAQRLGTSASNLTRWKTGQSRPRKQMENRLRDLVEGTGDLVLMAEISPAESHLHRLEEAIAGTIHELREEFHRSASVSKRQEVLDLVAALFFAHVTSIDDAGRGIGEHVASKSQTAVQALNSFMQKALSKYLPVQKASGSPQILQNRFYVPLTNSDEKFARQVLRIFDRDAAAFKELHKTGRDDLINDVFSRFMSTSFVDEKEMGQYLTPPEIVRFMVELGLHAINLDGRKQLLGTGKKAGAGLVLDPSCGVGSFLAEVIRQTHNKVRAEGDIKNLTSWLADFVGHRVIGIDKSERMTRLAIINLGLFGEQAAQVRLANALERKAGGDLPDLSLDGAVKLILTNPPFGATFSGTELDGFEMGQGRKRAESEILFLERYVDWLSPGGIAVTVIPDSILVNRGAFAQLRQWLFKRCHVEAVFSLPPVTFAASGTSTKTSVLILRKQSDVANKPTYFGEAKEVGFDVFTRSGQRRRVRSERTDLPGLLAEYRGERPHKLGRLHTLSEIDARWDAAYHISPPDNDAKTTSSGDRPLLKVSEVAKLVDERMDPKRLAGPSFPYIEISDIDARTGLIGSKQVPNDDAPSRARKCVRAGDVLVSTVRPERGGIGVIPDHLDGAICSTGFAVLRCFNIHPVVLAWTLRSEFVRRQMIRNNIGIAYPAISEETCLDIKLPVTRADIANLVEVAEMLVQKQNAYDGARKNFIEALDMIGRSNGVSSGQLPNIVNVSEPASVSDAA